MLSKKILCIGGSGQLGAAVLNALKPYQITNVDFKPNDCATSNLLLQSQSTPQQNNQYVIESLKKNPISFDAIVVTAGGWAGGSIKDDDYLQKYEQMINMNLVPTLLAGHLATKFLAPYGLVMLTGAAAVFKEPQPEMIAYSLAKTGVHSLALNLAEKLLEKGQDQRVITILPEIIDTVTNREAMPKANFFSWSKPQQIG